jgi:hypothetical protein
LAANPGQPEVAAEIAHLRGDSSRLRGPR